LVTAAREVWGLFVDDGKLALGLVLWCAVAGFGFRLLPLSRGADAMLLAVGCVTILAVTVFLAAARKRVG
jgi:hypothetical protein